MKPCTEFQSFKNINNTRFEESYLLGYNTMLAIESTCLHAGFLLSLVFDPEDGYGISL
jgi:hypothetical protein